MLSGRSVASLVDPEALVFAAHGAALRVMAANVDERILGVGVAGGRLRTRLGRSFGPSLTRRLLHLDAAAGELRHIAYQSVQAMLEELRASLRAAPSVLPPVVDVHDPVDNDNEIGLPRAALDHDLLGESPRGSTEVGCTASGAMAATWTVSSGPQATASAKAPARRTPR